MSSESSSSSGECGGWFFFCLLSCCLAVSGRHGRIRVKRGHVRLSDISRVDNPLGFALHFFISFVKFKNEISPPLPDLAVISCKKKDAPISMWTWQRRKRQKERMARSAD
ncbi:hypothetical protein QBC39DRAFT_90204 [Podospora conica]|nr:hypothetical protein QBC39DRAFT_90204 [Schizothecium conicum]